jgi:hypothetical protein
MAMLPSTWGFRAAWGTWARMAMRAQEVGNLPMTRSVNIRVTVDEKCTIARAWELYKCPYSGLRRGGLEE